MRKRTPEFRFLQAFEAAGRLGSFKNAADELNITPSAISHRISDLEASLGEKLFEPKGRNVVLTQNGRRFLRSIQKVLHQLNVATDQVTRKGVDGLFTIRVYPTVAHRWLIPRLESFVRKYPDVELNIVTTNSPLDFSSADTDVVIEYSPERFQGYECDLMAQDRVIAICSPKYLKTSSSLDKPADLLNHTLIHSAMRANEWRSWLEAANVSFEHSGQNIRVSTRDAAIEAAACGLGVALAHPPLVNELLETQRIVSPFDISFETGFKYYLVTTPERAQLPRVAAFRDWVASEIATNASVGPSNP